MRRLIVQPPATADIDSILALSRRQFGNVARERYSALIGQALENVRADPLRVGVKALPSLEPELRLYHLRHARARLAKRIRPTRPRHFIVFTFDDDDVRIVRVLYDSMDLSTQLAPPPEDDADESPA